MIASEEDKKSESQGTSAASARPGTNHCHEQSDESDGKESSA